MKDTNPLLPWVTCYRREEVSVGVTKQEDEESLAIREDDTETILKNTQIYVPSLKVGKDLPDMGPFADFELKIEIINHSMLCRYLCRWVVKIIIHIWDSEKLGNNTIHFVVWLQCYMHWYKGCRANSHRIIIYSATFVSKTDTIVSMHIALQSYNEIDGIVT